MSLPLLGFWISVAVVLYTVAVFPVWLFLLARLRPKPVASADLFPRLSVVIAAYNEAAQIAERIENLLESDYPADRVEIIVASDGSDDETDDIVRRYADRNARLVALPRGGKARALNAAVPVARGEILVFTDANTQFSRTTLRALARPFADSSVGGVAGNQIYLRDAVPSRTADGEMLHWTLDTRLKQLQAHAGSVTSATGAVYAIRAHLFQPIPSDAMDDFYVSTGVVAQGYRLVFAADAVAREPVAGGAGVEFSRKCRVMIQGLRAVLYRRALLNPAGYGFYAVQLFTHKVLRRLLAVPFLVMLAVSPWLWWQGVAYRSFVLAEMLFLGLALVGALAGETRLGGVKVFALPYFFCVANLAALVALVYTLLGKRLQRWAPERHAAAACTARQTHG